MTRTAWDEFGGVGVDRAETSLDRFAPAWQFHEFHARTVQAPPERVYDAMASLRADEILGFDALTWIRRGGRPLPSTILDPGLDAPLIDIAVRGGFVRLADDPPRELVIGTVVMAPDGPRPPVTAAIFQAPPPGYAVAVMNFHVRPDGSGGSLVTTATRVYASGASARRRFAVYWRLIYPGSAFIRRMWLRGIDRRATAARPDPTS